MLKPSLKTSLIALAVLTALASTASAAAPAKTTTGHATLKGVDYYYEVRGQGEPVLLLHGGLGSIDMFEPQLPAFAGRQLIAVDLQGHGRSTMGNRPMNSGMKPKLIKSSGSTYCRILWRSISET